MSNYTCDMCKETISGPNIVNIVKADELTFCNDACAESWLNAEIKKEKGKPVTNTKQRHNEIQSVAADLIQQAGGIEAIDALSQEEGKVVFNIIVDGVIKKTACASRQIARNNVAKAMRKGRDYLGEMEIRGGTRVPGPGKTLGPDPMPPGQKRQRATTRLAPGYVEKAKRIAEVKGLAGWGRAVEMALDLMIERDPELV